MSTRDRALAALTGLAVGDALGMPTQSMSRAEIRTAYGKITGFRQAVANQPVAPGLPAGSITDDTEQVLLLARLLVDGGGHVQPRVFADALLAWEADMIARGSADLLGPSTKRALQLLETGVPPGETGRAGTTNGAAMRVTPVGIATPPDDLATLVDAVAETARITHNTSLGLAAAAAVAAAVSAGVDGANRMEAFDFAERAAALGAAEGHWSAGGAIAARLRWARDWVRGLRRAELDDAVADVIGTSVAAQESVVAAFALAEVLDPAEALPTAAALGGDTDTVAAICGALLGACGEEIPAELGETVVRFNRLDLGPLAEGLVTLRRTIP
ncbi:ADP-ribosylglycohydrolase family protein [Amycolatopsis sp. FDAARGOS 1241]|uniref:ADP-ribosylglycohydrolase family protein n=1 Tax=Amycolatopsis sp. FDAARGOS 1241 TaxID=2778070 RepID=UPI0019524478|nr:ADP-ribosylglycohydrolase family protein [Amycolatopsis sp. FDAARGOS 1241]QRP46408.1 ADP-ribosylglycohydrolase family protein [Amycolatopsis sp. FDAARGOS 1241]